MTAVVAALGLTVALMAMVLVGLLRSNADVLRSLHDLGIRESELGGEGTRRRRSRDVRTTEGVPAPRSEGSGLGVHDIAGVTPDGGAVQVGLAGSGGLALLAFLSSGCSTCHAIWASLGTGDVEALPGYPDTRIIVVTQGPDEESPAGVRDLAPEGLTTVMSTAAWEDYEIPVSPYFVLVDGERGVVGEGAAGTWSQLIGLLQKAVADVGLPPVLSPDDVSRRELLRGRRLADRADRALLAAGIDPSLPDEGQLPVEPGDIPDAGRP